MASGNGIDVVILLSGCLSSLTKKWLSVQNMNEPILTCYTKEARQQLRHIMRKFIFLSHGSRLLG